MRYFSQTILYLILWLTVTSLAQAQTPTQQLKKSQQQWLKLAKELDFSYSFDLLGKTRGRTFRTVVAVKRGKVVGAVQLMTSSPSTSTEYNPVPKTQLKRLPTLSKVYQEAIDKIVKKAGKNLRLNFDKKGLLVQAGYERVGCKGDCYEGYRIGGINLKKHNPQAQLVMSWSAWATTKKAWNNQYMFTTKHTRLDKDLMMEKTVTVRQGKIIKVVEVRSQAGNASRRLYTRAERYRVGQMDKIYQRYFTVFSKPPAHNQQHVVYLAENGLIASIGAQVIDCTVDCFKIFSISNLRKW